jgi:hypothetical protein
MSSILKGIPDKLIPFDKSSTYLLDGLVLFSIIGLGFMGCFYCFGSVHKQVNYSPHEVPLHLEIQSKLVPLEFENNKIKVTGNMETGSKILVSIDKELKQNPLYLDFGDGNIEKAMATKEIQYHYSMPGNYTINLFTIDNRQRIILSSKDIMMKHGASQYSSIK